MAVRWPYYNRCTYSVIPGRWLARQYSGTADREGYTGRDSMKGNCPFSLRNDFSMRANLERCWDRVS